MSRRILIINGDSGLSRSLEELFGQQGGYETISAANAEAGLALLGEASVDLVILDEAAAQNPALGDGVLDIPRLVLSEAAPADAAAAENYLVMPFRFRDLLARLRLAFRNSEAEDSTISLGRFVFRPGAKLLLDAEGEKTYLTEKESSILKFLHQAGDAVVGRELLLSEVWGYNSGVTTHTLETHIYRLRQKIERDPSNAEILVTDAGGYRLVP